MLWGLYNCIGPYLLLHYSYIGRQQTLTLAATAGMAGALGLAALAVSLLVALTPTSHDLAQVRTPQLLSSRRCCGVLHLPRLRAVKSAGLRA